MTSPTFLGIDVGGTSVKALLVDGEGVELGEWREPTPHDDSSGNETAALVIGLLQTAQERSVVAAVGLAVPGEVDDDTGIVINAVNLGWLQLPFRSMVQQSIEVPLAFGHDVRVGALAESISAGTRGAMLFVPIGTGIASALVIDGVPTSRLEWPGELGQVVIEHGDLAGQRLEDVASAGGIARRAGQPNAHAVAELVLAGDAAARAIWTDAVEAIADALVVATLEADPRTIVVGGGLAESGALLFEPLVAAVESRMHGRPVPEIRPALLGDRAAVIGATHIARRLRELVS